MTDYKICSQDWQATISSRGAELKSLKNLETQEEYIWQADPDIWASSAPILFPIIGRLRHGQVLVDGKPYPLPKHGIARAREFENSRTEFDQLTLKLTSNSETRSFYPYDFSLEVSFNLNPGVLAISYKITNKDTKPLFFTIGSHPAFRLPLENSCLEDYSLRFSEKETLDRYTLQDGLMPDSGLAFMKNESLIRLTPDIFNQDALIFRNIASKKISIVHRKKGCRLSLLTGGAPHLGIWAKPGAPFVCIEPWFGHDDSVTASGNIEEKPGMIILSAGSRFQTGIAIQI